jgi:hypothetical protein
LIKGNDKNLTTDILRGENLNARMKNKDRMRLLYNIILGILDD